MKGVLVCQCIRGKNESGKVHALLAIEVETNPSDYKMCGSECRFFDPRSSSCFLFVRKLDLDISGNAKRCRRCKMAVNQFSKMSWGMSDRTDDLIKA